MLSESKKHPIHILLSDDDTDDCFFFEKAIDEIPIDIKLDIVRDGEQLLNYLHEHQSQLPDMLFLDLSMPRKTGFECLSEIRENEAYKNIYIVMFSTSYSRDLHYEDSMIVLLRDLGADQYIRKSSDFTRIVKIINKFSILRNVQIV